MQAFTCRVGKILKERIRVVCCPWYGKGEQLEREVVKMAKVTTRGREGSPQAHLLCPCHRRDPQPESQETLKSLSSFSLVGLTVSLVTVHLADLRFFLFLVSILGEVVAMGEEGPVLAVLGAELSPFKALTNFPPLLGRISIAAGLGEGGGDSALGGLAIVGRPHERQVRI